LYKIVNFFVQNKKIVPVTGTMVVFLLSEQAGGTLNAEPDEQAEQNGGP